MEIGSKQCDKEDAFFWLSKRKKKQARKNEPPSVGKATLLLETDVFFRPTPLGFRQIVQHVQLHVA